MASYAHSRRGTRRVFLHDMVLQAAIGVYAHEHRGTQRVRINVELCVREAATTDGGQRGCSDELSDVVDYEMIANRVRRTVEAGHVNLVETLAERIAAAILVESRVLRLRIRVEKLDVFLDTASVGVEIERRQPISRRQTVRSSTEPT